MGPTTTASCRGPRVSPRQYPPPNCVGNPSLTALNHRNPPLRRNPGARNVGRGFEPRPSWLMSTADFMPARRVLQDTARLRVEYRTLSRWQCHSSAAGQAGQTPRFRFYKLRPCANTRLVLLSGGLFLGLAAAVAALTAIYHDPNHEAMSTSYTGWPGHPMCAERADWGLPARTSMLHPRFQKKKQPLLTYWLTNRRSVPTRGWASQLSVPAALHAGGLAGSGHALLAYARAQLVGGDGQGRGPWLCHAHP